MSYTTSLLALVPDEVVALSALHENIHCNLRDEQRPKGTDDCSRALYMELYEPFLIFLNKIFNQNIRIAVLFQNYDGKKLGSAVFDLKEVHFDEKDYPLIMYKGMKSRTDLIPGWVSVDLWGAFLLAVAEVLPDTEIYIGEDPGAERFIRVVQTAVCKPVEQ